MTFEYLGVLERNKRKRDNGSYTSTTYTIKNIDSITQEKFQIVYQQIKGYLKKSQSELVSKKIPVNSDGLKSEQLEPSSLYKSTKSEPSGENPNLLSSLFK